MDSATRKLLRRMTYRGLEQETVNVYGPSDFLTKNARKKAIRRAIRKGLIDAPTRIKMNPRWGHNVFKITAKGRRVAFMLGRREKRQPDFPDVTERWMRPLGWHHRTRKEADRI